MASDATRSIIQLMSFVGYGPAAVRKVVTWASARGIPVERVVAEPSMLAEAVGKRTSQVVRREGQKAEAVVEQLEEDGISFVSIADEDYPERIRTVLGDVAPPVLSFRGDLGLLGRLSVGFCGSRKASDRGLKAATDCADALTRSGVTIVSGYAAGVDSVAHHTALAAGGTTVAVLAEGMAQFRVRKRLSDVWDWKRSLVVSEFLPWVKWQASSAMQRNLTICAISRAMILIEARPNSGSYAAGVACLDLGIPLYAAAYDGNPHSSEGNRLLMELGAVRISRTAKKEPNLTEILRAVHEPLEVVSLESSEQLSLFSSSVEASRVVSSN